MNRQHIVLISVGLVIGVLISELIIIPLVLPKDEGNCMEIAPVWQTMEVNSDDFTICAEGNSVDYLLDGFIYYDSRLETSRCIGIRQYVRKIEFIGKIPAGKLCVTDGANQVP